MLIVCPNCATSYEIIPESLGETGRSVRCVNCHTVWFEQPRQPTELSADEADTDAGAMRPPLDDEFGVRVAPDNGALSLHDGEIGAQAAAAVEDALASSDNQATDHPQIDATQNIESVAARRAGKRTAARRRPAFSQHALPASICALVLVLACLVAARQQIVRFLPQTASLYARIGLPVNLRGLAFENIKTSREVEDGVPMLIVEGDIVGTTARHTEVPRLRFAVLDGTGKEIYAWTARPARNLLPPGEALPFRSRLASPPGEASGVSVRFFNRRDAQAGLM